MVWSSRVSAAVPTNEQDIRKTQFEEYAYSADTSRASKISLRAITGMDYYIDTSTFGTKPYLEPVRKVQTKHIGLPSTKPSGYSFEYKDPFYYKEWYLHDKRVLAGPVMDHNIIPLHRQGFKGFLVVVGIIGDGVQQYVQDMGLNIIGPNTNEGNYNEERRVLAMPDRDYKGVIDSESTKMAGVILMQANNGVCGVGVAHEAKVAGIKLQKIFNKITDYEIAKAITFNVFLQIDVYAFSYGRSDDGIFMESSKQIAKAFLHGTTKGRRGKGAIYVVGAGDGKESGKDNCAADDLVNDPHTIVIGSANQFGKVTPYSERCSAIMATAYSSGYAGDEQVVTMNANEDCTDEYSGTNPSVGIAAGIFALIYQVSLRRKDLKFTHRDMKHLIAMTAEVAPLADNSRTWGRNKAGFYFSNDFGFGLLNAENMASKLNDWISVPQMTTCELTFNFDTKVLETRKTVKGTGELQMCEGKIITAASVINYMEQVSLISTVSLEYRGSLTITLTSPKGTNVVMLEKRTNDYSNKGLVNWGIKTAHFWGEKPSGQWIVYFTVESLPVAFKSKKNTNLIKDIKLIVQGTNKKPGHYPIVKKDPVPFRTYSSFYSNELHGR